MRWFTLLLVPVVGVLLFWSSRSADSAEKADAKSFGIDKRTPWTTSKVKGSPEPPHPYRTVVAFPGVKFAEPLDLTYVPGAHRLAVAERRGKIFTFANKTAAKTADLLIDLKKTVY